MQARRKFLKIAALGAAIFSLDKKTAATPSQLQALGSKPAGPLVISTWSFGIQANEAAWKILRSGGRALDAVEQGVWVPEADPNNQSVGLGGLPDCDGRVTLDACIMDEYGNAGSVAAIEHIVHPVSVARLVMEKTPHVMLVGDGALQFALANGFKKENLLTPASEKAWKEWLKTSEYKPIINIEDQLSGHHNNIASTLRQLPGNAYNHDTIGMLAKDANGNLAGACTTSGMAYKLHGRVGDSPIIGAGLYVDNEVGAATATGVGEEVIKIVGSHLVVELMRQGHTPQDACKMAIERIVKRDASKARQIQVGFIALNKNGEYGGYCLQKGFSYAVCSGNEKNILIDVNAFF